jgi:GNAT superfamily N-acetyltransferase
MIADPVTVRPARPEEGPAVLSVLDEAAAWLAGRGIAQWPPAFRPEWIEPGLGEGRMWVAETGDGAVATFALHWSDPLWVDALGRDDGRAGYLHRFAVRRGHAGIGAALLDWIDGEVRRNGRDRLRLDCGADNARLRGYYEAAGFEHRGDVAIPESLTLWSPGRPLLSRYERSVVR